MMIDFNTINAGTDDREQFIQLVLTSPITAPVKSKDQDVLQDFFNQLIPRLKSKDYKKFSYQKYDNYPMSNLNPNAYEKKIYVQNKSRKAIMSSCFETNYVKEYL